MIASLYQSGSVALAIFFTLRAPSCLDARCRLPFTFGCRLQLAKRRIEQRSTGSTRNPSPPSFAGESSKCAPTSAPDSTPHSSALPATCTFPQSAGPPPHTSDPVRSPVPPAATSQTPTAYSADRDSPQPAADSTGHPTPNRNRTTERKQPGGT